MSFKKTMTTVMLSIFTIYLIAIVIGTESSADDKSRSLYKIPESKLNEFSQTETYRDTSDCEIVSYADDPAYFWKCPQPEYGDEMYAMRFDQHYQKRASFLYLLMYDDGTAGCSYDSGFYVVFFDDDWYGLPNNEIARIKIQPEEVVLFPGLLVVDIGSLNIFDDPFHVAVQAVDDAPGYIALISDDGDSGTGRSSTFHSEPFSNWQSMLVNWNYDVNFHVYIEYCTDPRTIRVPEDFDNIKDAVFAATDHDTILVNDGTYSGYENVNMELIYKSIVIQSVNGPEFTIIEAPPEEYSLLISCYHYTNGSFELDGFTIKNFDIGYYSGIIFTDDPYKTTIRNSVFMNNNGQNSSVLNLSGYDLLLENCTFYNNSSESISPVISIGYTEDNPPIIRNTIIANSSMQYSINAPSNIEISCTNIYGNESGDWRSNFKDQLKINGNMSVDPLFCDPLHGDLHINEESYCNPLHPLNSCGELIGYYGVNCTGCTDSDGDGICDANDNCINMVNSSQEDADYDFIGDICDSCPRDALNDVDADGHCADVDNCPYLANPDQLDSDGDSVGDICDSCPNDYDPDQLDLDEDGLGDACEECPDDPDNDIDADGFCLNDDNCPTTYNPNQIDSDADGVGDLCDNCPDDYDPDVLDTDADGIGDLCDDCTDQDEDGFGTPGFTANICPDDNCYMIYNPDQADSDNDGIGDACDGCFDPDADGFGTPGEINPLCFDDNCPDHYNPDQIDSDGDGVGDACCCIGNRGNVDYDTEDKIDIADLVYFVSYSFGAPSGPSPRCPNEADIDASGAIDIADIVALVAYMFGGASIPPVCP